MEKRSGRTLRWPVVPIAVAGLLAASAGWLGWRVSDASLPPLARGMPANFAQGARLFHDRVAAAYPPGSAAGRLRLDLGAQGFEIEARPGAEPFTGTLRRFNGCGESVWIVAWREREEEVTTVEGTYGANCL